WLLPWGTPLTLLGDSQQQVAAAQRELVRIGIDRPAAQATAPLTELAGRSLSTFDLVSFADLDRARRSGEVAVLDVRRDAEWNQGHLKDARHIPLHELLGRTDEVTGPVWVHCASGYRATIAGSMLSRAGKDVTVVADSFDAAGDAGLPLEAGLS
ncbi:MAG: metallo-beta-lactamase superfamily protein, partial [Frankiales bacterium]|nr:metallo-beta-lactamase superfamily protein [Frankiales bacterium]